LDERARCDIASRAGIKGRLRCAIISLARDKSEARISVNVALDRRSSLMAMAIEL